MIDWRKKDTVIFDMDGTVLNTLEDLANSVNHVMRELGYPQQSLEKVRQSVGNGAGKLFERVLPGGKDDPVYEEAVQMHVAFYEKHCRIKTGPYTGLPEVMAQLKKKGVRMAIVSNKGDGAVKKLAEEFFEGLVDVAVGEREGIRIKPAPDSVFEAMRLLGSHAETSVYVGDSEVDYETAKNAGIPGILVSWGFRDKDFLQSLAPDMIIDEPTELLSLLRG